jgi:hypothetical protein
VTAVICKFTAPRSPKISLKHAAYITRESATLGDACNLYFHNLPDIKGIDYREVRTRFLSFVEGRLDEEQCRTQRGRGIPRTYYSCLLSFDRKEGTGIAISMAAQFLKENFPHARAAISCHRDTEHTHCHIWLDARQLDDRKIQLSNHIYERLDERWARIYGKQYGEKYETDHIEKKEATRVFKQALARGEQPTSPLRHNRKRLTRSEYQQREIRNAGNDQSGVREIERVVTTTHTRIDESERTTATVERESRNTFEKSRELQQTIARLDRTHRSAVDRADQNKGVIK